jgi:small subunit ribosomal protein S8
MDPIADMLTCIRNASHALLPEVEVPHSKLKENVARVLKQEGYIADCTVANTPPKKMRLKLKFQGRKGVIENLRRVSTPGLRRYVRSVDIPRVLGGMGTVIMSTPRGVMTGTDARKNNLGGELICFVW